MNNPYPTTLQLRAETAIDQLLAEQAAVTATFLTIIRTAQAAIAKLEFPLGSPSHRYDLADITEALAEWQEGRAEQSLEDAAEDLVLERLGQ
jgi:hypothetical protein